MKVYLAGIESRCWLLAVRTMEIYIAGGNGKWRILAERERERESMDIYMAGGITGNLFPLMKQITHTHTHTMQIYLAGEHPVKNGAYSLTHSLTHRPLVLESFFYCRKNEVIPKLLPTLGGFLLDSGAFTFMQGKTSVNWDEYTEEYAEWIKAYNIEHFFELDIDSIVGLKKVERLRLRLEQLTGRQPIPVWHKSRGKDYFLSTCKDYKYVAIGGIVTQEIPRQLYESGFPWFIAKAHENGAKIHGLGYTSIEGIHKYHFDSVDSTAWLYGNRGGYLYQFNNKTGLFNKVRTPKGTRLKSQEAALYNFNEWIKFQQYALKKL